jgi:hypothetical protein
LDSGSLSDWFLCHGVERVKMSRLEYKGLATRRWVNDTASHQMSDQGHCGLGRAKCAQNMEDGPIALLPVSDSAWPLHRAVIINTPNVLIKLSKLTNITD